MVEDDVALFGLLYLLLLLEVDGVALARSGYLLKCLTTTDDSLLLVYNWIGEHLGRCSAVVFLNAHVDRGKWTQILRRLLLVLANFLLQELCFR